MTGFKAQDRIHRQSIATPISQIATQLLQVLGARLAAMVVGLSDSKALAAYARGERSPQPDTSTRLRLAQRVVATLLQGELSNEAIQSWFTGMNPDLDDECPAEVILESPRRVLDAARGFVELGADADAEARTENALPSAEAEEAARG